MQGLADDEVCIGDRYQIGGAVFEVTQPRVTCFRVGIRMDDPRIPALLVSHHRPGFYFRVLTEGAVQAGDEIIKLASGPEGMTVAEIDALHRIAYGARTQINRKDFGLSFSMILDGRFVVSEEIQIAIEGELVEQQQETTETTETTSS